jgi:hypothetical protein
VFRRVPAWSIGGPEPPRWGGERFACSAIEAVVSAA